MSALRKKTHTHCFACSADNPLGLQLDFQMDGDTRISAGFSVNPEFQGYNNCVHGGIISTIMDSAMTNLLLRNGIPAMTAELKVRFKQPMSLNKQSTVIAELVKSRHPVYELNSSIFQEDKLIARAEARFMLPIKHKLNTEAHCSSDLNF